MIATAARVFRDRLAAVILEARHDPAARRRLARLAADLPTSRRDVGDLPSFRQASPGDAVLLRARARRALAALATCPRLPDGASLDEVLVVAAALFDAGLYFEVHELLEPYWRRAAGSERRALQGLIQIAVGFQHLANGNLAGARTLVAAGSARARSGDLRGLALDAFVDGVSSGLARLAGLPTREIPRFPSAAPRRGAGGGRSSETTREERRGPGAQRQDGARDGSQQRHRPGGRARARA